MHEHASPNRLLTMPEVADRLGMSSRWVRQMVADKQIASVRLGRAIRVFPEDVEAFARGRRHGSRG